MTETYFYIYLYFFIIPVIPNLLRWLGGQFTCANIGGAFRRYCGKIIPHNTNNTECVTLTGKGINIADIGCAF